MTMMLYLWTILLEARCCDLVRYWESAVAGDGGCVFCLP